MGVYDGKVMNFHITTYVHSVWWSKQLWCKCKHRPEHLLAYTYNFLVYVTLQAVTILHSLTARAAHAWMEDPTCWTMLAAISVSRKGFFSEKEKVREEDEDGEELVTFKREIKLIYL